MEERLHKSEGTRTKIEFALVERNDRRCLKDVKYYWR